NASFFTSIRRHHAGFWLQSFSCKPSTSLTPLLVTGHEILHLPFSSVPLTHCARSSPSSRNQARPFLFTFNLHHRCFLYALLQLPTLLQTPLSIAGRNLKTSRKESPPGRLKEKKLLLRRKGHFSTRSPLLQPSSTDDLLPFSKHPPQPTSSPSFLLPALAKNGHPLFPSR
ncbi:hypothetical protein BDY24DRAFT_440925, partial [Mrakia frigida]|uniref:uncharacterized protein n=1 Tax=Mrakia frigida TaxID=29902 RepID=UPI003FCC1D7C